MSRFSIIGLFVVVVCLALCPDVALSKQLVALKVKPENVGVFFSNKTQQFQAIAVFDDGSEADYTKKVGWSLEKNPFFEQELKPEQVAKIDKFGLATVLSSWGRVKVTATYPPPGTFSPSMILTLLLSKRTNTAFLPGILSLLLKSEDTGQPAPIDNTLTLQGDNGPLRGGNLVAINARNISNGIEGDITRVQLNGVDAQVLWFDRDNIYASAGRASVPGYGKVEVVSQSRGVRTMVNRYTYNQTGTIEQITVLPDAILIKGENLGNGTDIYAVRISGSNTQILEQSASALYVKTMNNGKGKIEIFSHSHGVTIKENSSSL